jgi:hypothetical protein
MGNWGGLQMTIQTTAIACVAAAAMVTGSLYGAYHHGVKVTDSKYQAIIAAAGKAHADEVISLNGKVAQAEHKAALDMAAIDQRHQEDIEHEKQIAAGTLASYRAGTLRLRNEFQAHIIADTGVPSVAASAGQRDAAGSGGLQPAHVEFFVSEAERANQVVKQLAACQAVVRADRSVVAQP